MAREKYEHVPIPIPTYEEATASSSRLTSSSNVNIEREGLLSGAATNARRNGNYQPPTVESVRNSMDSGLTELISNSDEDEEQGLRQDMEQMEEGESSDEIRARERAAGRRRFTKRINDTLTSLHLPRFPKISFSFINFRFPELADEYKPGWSILARLAGIAVIAALVYALVVLKIFSPQRIMGGQRYAPSAIRQFTQGAIERDNIENFLRQISYDDHLAGTKGDFFLARYIEDHFKAAGLDSVYLDDYQVYLNYPIPGGRRVAIIDPPELTWEAILEEDKSSSPDQHEVQAFHGHSRTGNVTGPLIYANYGSREDFAYLKQQGIDLNGTIVLIKYYGKVDQALKVKAAELAGAAGCLLYSDPTDDGFLRGPVWPEGPYRKADSVQRGGVSLTSWIVGDVLTPGNVSKPGVDRLSRDNNAGLNNIPSLPLAWRDAQVLLKSLKSHGIQVPSNWIGGVPEVEWWSGDASTSPTVHLRNLQDENDHQPIRNVMGRIEGYEDPDATVYVGNHRDAWCFGAVDPGSGTAVQLELVRVFGELIALGWRPRRSIVFASWDGEEYNLIGSTEHVEERIDQIRAHGIGYINVDSAVSGSRFDASASPLFERVLLRVLGRVTDPGGNGSLADTWNQTRSVLKGLDAGSDYVAFQDLAGCSSLDIGFTGEPHASPYHSCYESFEWMKKFGDPTFEYHVALAQVQALLILELADEPVIPFDLTAYAREVVGYVASLKRDAEATAERFQASAEQMLNIGSLEEATDLLVKNAAPFMEWEDKWMDVIMNSGGMEFREAGIRRVSHNARVANFETNLLDLPLSEEDRVGGIPGRTQFKHIIFGPRAWFSFDEAYFPAVRDALDVGDWAAAQAQLDIVARVLRNAALKLPNESGDDL